MKTAMEFLYEFYPCILREPYKNDFEKFCNAYDTYLDSLKPKNELTGLIKLREQYFSEYLKTDFAEKKFYRKQWKDIDKQIYNLIQAKYDQLTIKYYKNEFYQDLILVKTEVPEIIEQLNKKVFLYNAFTGCFEKMNYNNTFFSLIKNIAIYL